MNHTRPACVGQTVSGGSNGTRMTRIKADLSRPEGASREFDRITGSFRMEIKDHVSSCDLSEKLFCLIRVYLRFIRVIRVPLLSGL
jgi:hypothetical protein